MLRKARTSCSPKSIDNIDYTSRESGLLNERGQEKSTEWCLFSGLQHDSVTARESRSELPSSHLPGFSQER
jgi:hypothetical protein